MTITTAYFPPIAIIELIAKANPPIEAHETFQKHSPRNRTQIMTAQGPKLLSIPLVGGRGTRCPITTTEIDYTTPFQQNHLKTIISAYRSAPYFEHYFPKIEPLFALHEKYLFDLNTRITQEILKILRLDVELQFTTSFQGAPTTPLPSSKPYYQVFGDKEPFAPNLSILDWIFCQGPQPIGE